MLIALKSYDGGNQSFSFIHNGRLTNVQNKRNPMKTPGEDLNSRKIVEMLRLGKYSDNKAVSMSGKISDVNAWCESLSANDMVRWTNCDKIDPEPDLGMLSL